MEKIKLADINLYVLGIALIGYAFFNKSFAYVGASPIFVGELVLASTALMVVVSGPNLTFLRSPIVWALFAYVSWQIVVFATAGPSINLYTLRDSAVWYYSIFSVIVAAALLKTRAIDRTCDWYGRWMPWFVIWAPIGFLIQAVVGEALPRFPGQEFPFLNVKPGDLQVHLAGAIVFLMLGLHRVFPRVSKYSFRYMEHVCWTFLTFGIIALGSRTRAGLLSIIAAVTVATILKPKNRLLQFLLPAIFVFSLFALLDIRIPLPGGREVSTHQIMSNVESVLLFGDSDRKRTEGQGTADWRLEWWQIIIDETIGGEYFWTGRGFGSNLAEHHGFADATPNRSPHNGHLTILARSGVPGVTLWFILIATIYVSLLRRYFNSLRSNENVAAKVDLWVLAYLTAFLVNTSFDVYLEGPQGGIWFWCLVGFAIALTDTQRAKATRQVGAQMASVRHVARP